MPPYVALGQLCRVARFKSHVASWCCLCASQCSSLWVSYRTYNCYYFSWTIYRVYVGLCRRLVRASLLLSVWCRGCVRTAGRSIGDRRVSPEILKCIEDRVLTASIGKPSAWCSGGCVYVFCHICSGVSLHRLV